MAEENIQVRYNRLYFPEQMLPPDQNDDMAPSNPFEPFPFQGGCNTSQEKPLLPTGAYSTLENLRNKHPGIEQRGGSTEVLSSAYGTATPKTIHNFSKTRVSEDYEFVQWGDGTVYKLGYDAGVQSLIKTNSASQIPGSWSKVRDILVHSNGVDQHQTFVGGAGPQLCPDPTCATDFFDTKGTGWSHDAGNDEYDSDASQTADSDLEEASLIVSGLTYTVTFEVDNWVAGNVCPVCGDQEGTDRGADGVFTEDVVSDGTTFKIRADASFNGSVTNIFIRESTSNYGNYVDGFLVLVETTAAPVRIIDEGISDYSIEVSDPDNSDVGTIGNLHDCDESNDWDAIYVRTPVPATSFYFDVATAQTAISVATVQYRKNDDSWADVANQWDTTVATTTDLKTLAQDGTISWDSPTDEVPLYMAGYSGFWYRIKFSVDLTNTPTVNTVRYGSNFTDIQNVWDGIPPYAIEASRYDYANTAYSQYASDTINLSDFGTSVEGTPGTFSTTADYVYFNSADPIEGFYIDVGETPNKSADSGEPIYAYYWNGAAWTNLTINDGTDELSKSGWITFAQQSTTQPRQFNDSRYYSYWYCFTIGVEITNQDHATDTDYDMYIAIQTMPYFSIDDFGTSLASGAWKDRTCYSFNRWPSYVYISKQNQPLMLNGSDFGVMQAGDGRMNKVLAIKKFVNEIMVFQEETGEEGGCVTIFEGYNPTTYGRLVLSSKVGILNGKCVEVVDGVITSTRTDERVQTIAYWISRYGVFATDGRTVYAVSDPIGNYFDPVESECIRKGYEDQHWMSFDSKDNVLRLGLVSGGSATTPNVFPVFDIATSSWSFDVYAGKKISCMTEIEAPSGSIPVFQVAGGVSSGMVYRMNTGDLDEDDTTITSKVVMEVNAGGYEAMIDELIFRTKANTVAAWTANTAKSLLDTVERVASSDSDIFFECTVAGTTHATTEPTWDTTPGNTTSDGTVTWTCRSHGIKFSSYVNGTISTNGDLKSMQQESSEEARRHRFNENLTGDNLAIEFKNDVKNKKMRLLDMGMNMKIRKWQ